jgi:hypothetical protein
MTIHISPGATPEPEQPATTQTTTAATLTGDTSGANSPDFIDEREMLRRLPVSRRTLCVWLVNGQIPVVKINRRNLFHWPSVEAALLNLQRGGK